jgi:hypothetical protein
VYDPLRALVTCASAEHVERVVVAGRTVVVNGKMCSWNEEQVLADARASCEGVWASFPSAHWSGRSIEEVFPPSLQAWREP